MSKEKERHVDTTLDPELYRKFLAVKKHYDILSNRSVLRLTVALEYDRITEESTTE